MLTQIINKAKEKHYKKKAIRTLRSRKDYKAYKNKGILLLQNYGSFESIPKEIFYLKDAVEVCVPIKDRDPDGSRNIKQKYEKAFPNARIIS